MVQCFHRTELELLLGISSESRDGRRTDLMQRALSMVDRGVSPSVESKIRDLYRKSGASTSRNSVMYSRRLSSQGSVGTSALSKSGSSSNSSSRLASHRATTDSSRGSRRPAHGLGARHEVVLKTLPFYDVLGEIMKPSSLVPRNTARQQEMKFNFTFTQQHCNELKQSRDGSSADHHTSTQVQLRFCLRDTKSPQSDKFPLRVDVKVNNKAAQLPNIIPTNKPGAEPKRPGRPINITHLCDSTPAVVNSIVVLWTVEQDRSYCVAVYLVKKLNSDILLSRLKQNSMRPCDYTKQLIRDKLSLDRDHDLATTSLCISLLCPLGKVRTKLPCRAVTCDHLQCFDALTYLRMNEKKATWICPVCDRHADYSKLIIDGLIADIMSVSRDAVEVALTDDGSYQVTQTADSDVDDDDDDDEYDAFLPPSEPAPQSGDDMSSSDSDDGDPIDLTASDDERMATSSIADSNSLPSAGPVSESSNCSNATDRSNKAAESAPDLPPMPPQPSELIPLPSPPVAPPLPPLPSSPQPPPEPDSAPPLPMAPPPLPPAAIGYSPYPKIPVSLRSTTPSYTYPPAMPHAAYMPYPSMMYAPAAYGQMAMAPNGVMYDFMSTMSGMADYSAFSVSPAVNSYGYPSANGSGEGPTHH